MSVSVARITVGKTRILLSQARAAVLDRPVFEANFEAAIVLARTVTLHLQKEYAHTPGFPTWWSSQQAALAEDHLARFFLETRNYILKEGPPALIQLATVQLQGSIEPEGSLTVRALRGRPWYKRSPRIWWQDLRQRAPDWIARPRMRPQRKVLEQLSRMREVPGTATAHYQFLDEEWAGRDAAALLEDNLDTLESVTLEAEARFGSA